MATPWHLGRLAPFDLETTGPDPEDARIVEAYLGNVGGGIHPIDPDPILIDPGVEVPEEAAGIHGYTTEFLRAHGNPAPAAVDLVAAGVADALREQVPLVGHNISYDLTVLDRECRRHQLPTVAERTGGALAPVIDTKVLSKRVDPWRRRVSEEQGAHVLKTCAQVFGIGWDDDDAHGARADALVSARIAWRLGTIAHMPHPKRPHMSGRGDNRGRFDDLAVDVDTLHAHQQRWAAEQAASYQEFLRSAKAGEQQDPDAVIDGSWPVVPAPAAAIPA